MVNAHRTSVDRLASCLTPQTYPPRWNKACTDSFVEAKPVRPWCAMWQVKTFIAHINTSLISNNTTSKHCGPRPCPLWLHRLHLGACWRRHPSAALECLGECMSALLAAG